MKKIHELLSSKLFIIFNFMICVALIALTYYYRHMMHVSFKNIYAVSMIMLVLSFVVFFFSYKNKEAELNDLVAESCTGYIYFLSFILITFILRG